MKLEEQDSIKRNSIVEDGVVSTNEVVSISTKHRPSVNQYSDEIPLVKMKGTEIETHAKIKSKRLSGSEEKIRLLKERDLEGF